MFCRFLILLTTLLIATVSTFGQEPPTPVAEASPTSNPPVRRRTFDQFDLSNGVGIKSTATSGVKTPPAVVEQVDQQTYIGIARMVNFAADIEAEFRSTDGIAIDASDHFEPYRVLARKIPALYRITEVYRSGLLDEVPLTNSANVELLTQNQGLIIEITKIAFATDAQLAQNQAVVIPTAEKFGVANRPVVKRPLLYAMFARLNKDFSRLMTQVAVAK